MSSVELIEELVAELRWWLNRHDRDVRCAPWKKGEIYERRSPRPRKDGRNYVFVMSGPEGMGFYPCVCNRTRALLARLKEQVCSGS